jgi:hypothetical protein
MQLHCKANKLYRNTFTRLVGSFTDGIVREGEINDIEDETNDMR